ncbi:MAG: GNAT family N-acetyltransferase [Candidatus Eisenbacteria bacterium]
MTEPGDDARSDLGLSENPLEALEWGPARGCLAFRIGEWILFRVGTDLLRCRTHFLKIPVLSSPEPPRRLLDERGASGALVPSCPVESPIPRLSRRGGWVRYATWHYDHQLVRIEGSFSEYEAAMSRKTRETLRRKVRRFLEEAGGGESFKMFAGPEEMAVFWEDARKVAGRTYQERLFGEAIPASDSYREELIERARRGRVLGFVLYRRGEPVAYTVGDVVGEGVVLYGYTGYLTELRKLSPGTVLQHLLIRALFDSGRARVYDLCVGEAEHKRLFSNESRLAADVYFFRPSLRNRCLVLGHIAVEGANVFIVKVLDALRIKQVIKRIVRRSA